MGISTLFKENQTQGLRVVSGPAVGLFCPSDRVYRAMLKHQNFRRLRLYMAMGHNLWLHFGVDAHPFATSFDVHQGYRVLTHSQMGERTQHDGKNSVRHVSMADISLALFSVRRGEEMEQE